MKECSKSIMRRLGDSNYVRRYFVGDGVDIGGAPDPLAMYQELFPRMTSARIWDLNDGDAQFMAGVEDETFDFVFSSHCLEHIRDPAEALANWMRILKPGGHLVVAVPDEDLYEQGVWPSTHNRDHKHTFTLMKTNSWSPASINLLALLGGLGPLADIRKIELLDQSYRFEAPRFDQTLTPVGECGIEFVIRKRTSDELEAGGRLPPKAQPQPAMRPYWNQYRADQQALKSFAGKEPPFQDDSEI